MRSLQSEGVFRINLKTSFFRSGWMCHIHGTLAVPTLDYLHVIFQHVGNELGHVTLPSFQTIKSSKMQVII